MSCAGIFLPEGETCPTRVRVMAVAGKAAARDYEHAFDPYAEPDLFRGVLTRRVIAFLIDLIVLSVPVILASSSSRSSAW